METLGLGTLKRTRAAVRDRSSWCVLVIYFDCSFDQCIVHHVYFAIVVVNFVAF